MCIERSHLVSSSRRNYRLSWKKHNSPENEEEECGVKEESTRSGAAASISNCEHPAENPFSCLEGFWVGHDEENECGIKGIFCFQSEVNHLLFCVIFLDGFFALRLRVRAPPCDMICVAFSIL